MKKYLLIVLIVLLLPVNVFAGVCEPDKVIIESIELEEKTGLAEEKEEATVDGKSINLNLQMKKVGDSAEYKMVVKNDSDSDFELDEESFNLSFDYLDYSISTEDNSNIVKARSTKRVYLKVEYSEEVPSDLISSGTYTDNKRVIVEASQYMDAAPTSTPTATPVEPNGSSSTPTPTATPAGPKTDDKAINVPNTYASSKALIIIAGIALLGAAAYYYKKNKYVTYVILGLGLVAILSSRVSYSSCATSFEIDSSIEIQDKYAIFLSGKEVNTRMKKFVKSNADYSNPDSTITKFLRYTDTPDASYLVDANIVSTEDSSTPIYMWYDSANTTVYWYSVSQNIYYGEDSSYFFANLKAMDSISNLGDISSTKTKDMSHMFDTTGYNSTSFTLDLGNKFATSQVTNMAYMFFRAGADSTVFTLNLGDKFDTHNVTDMQRMFSYIGSKNPSFTFDFGDKFDTSKVTNMYDMFYYMGFQSTVFTLDLGDKFDTSNVTNMSGMFGIVGRYNTSFTLDLGDKFDTSKVTDMSQMFKSTGLVSTVFTLDLGDKFDTSNVTNMDGMFSSCGEASPVFTLDLGNNFNTSKVTSMSGMFYNIGHSVSDFTLDLGPLFNTSSVENMSNMFYNSETLKTIFAPSDFVIGQSTNTNQMFYKCTALVGGAGTVWDSYHIDGTYARLDKATVRPGYFTEKGTITAAIYFNGNSTLGSVSPSVIVTSCVLEEGSTSCTITPPSVVSNSVGKYNSPFNGLSSSLGSMSNEATISSYTVLYANYSAPATIYYFESGSKAISLHRNEFFTSTNSMEARLATTNTGTSNYTIPNGPGNATLSGLATDESSPVKFDSVQSAANSNAQSLYEVYTFSVNYLKGTNVVGIGKTSDSCSFTSRSSSCTVVLPTIAPYGGYSVSGWSQSQGASSGYNPGSNYTLSYNNLNLYANANRMYTCPTGRTPSSYTYGVYQLSPYGEYSYACQGRTGANPECGSMTVCGPEYSSRECHIGWTPDCQPEGPLWNEDQQSYYYCGYRNQSTYRTCTSYRCPTEVTSWNYEYGDPRPYPYGEYQGQCR